MSIQNDQVVSITYSVKDKATNEVVDSNEGKEPLKFIMGKGMIIQGLENGIKDMNVGDQKTIEVPASEAYGEYDPNAVVKAPREQFANIDLQKGMQLYAEGEGDVQIVTVKDFDDKEVTIDFNHPMAGKDLVFDVKIDDVRPATDEELNTLHIHQDSCGCGNGHC